MDKEQLKTHQTYLTGLIEKANLELREFLDKDNKSAGRRYRLLMLEVEKVSKSNRWTTSGKNKNEDINT